MATTPLAGYQLRAPPCDYDFEIITIIVGFKETSTFGIPRTLLQGSDYFQSALSGRWKESKEKVMRLPDDDPEIFRFYAGWLFGVYFMPTKRVLFKDSDTKTEQSRAHQQILVDAYLLGEKLGDCGFMDMALDTLTQYYLTFKRRSKSVIEDVYQHTLDGSQIRQFLVDYSFHTGNKITLKKWLSVPADFASAVPQEFMGERNDATNRNFEGWKRSLNPVCKYHTHVKEGKPCYLVKHPNANNALASRLTSEPSFKKRGLSPTSTGKSED